MSGKEGAKKASINSGKEMVRKLNFSTDLKQRGEKTVRYYRSLFQIEFLYRDAKQFTGHTSCQARYENKPACFRFTLSFFNKTGITYLQLIDLFLKTLAKVFCIE
jgi:hypothetical protein